MYKVVSTSYKSVNFIILVFSYILMSFKIPVGLECSEVLEVKPEHSAKVVKSGKVEDLSTPPL